MEQNEQLQKRAQRLWKKIWSTYLFLTCCTMILLAVLGIGPVAYLCEWQEKYLFSSRSLVTLSLFISLIPFLLLLIPMKKLFEKIHGVKLK